MDFQRRGSGAPEGECPVCHGDRRPFLLFPLLLQLSTSWTTIIRLGCLGPSLSGRANPTQSWSRRPKTARRDPPSRVTLDRAPEQEREDSLRAEKQALVLKGERNGLPRSSANRNRRWEKPRLMAANLRQNAAPEDLDFRNPRNPPSVPDAFLRSMDRQSPERAHHRSQRGREKKLGRSPGPSSESLEVVREYPRKLNNSIDKAPPMRSRRPAPDPSAFSPLDEERKTLPDGSDPMEPNPLRGKRRRADPTERGATTPSSSHLEFLFIFPVELTRREQQSRTDTAESSTGTRLWLFKSCRLSTIWKELRRSAAVGLESRESFCKLPSPIQLALCPGEGSFLHPRP